MSSREGGERETGVVKRKRSEERRGEEGEQSQNSIEGGGCEGEQSDANLRPKS